MKPAQFLLMLLSLALFPRTTAAQDIRVRGNAVFYGDNTEFSGPYRDGETIFGAHLSSWLSLDFGDGVEMSAGVFADRRHTADGGFDPVLPVLSLRIDTGSGRIVIGSNFPAARHQLIDPLEVSTLELTRPIEYGLAWVRKGAREEHDIFLSWQKLNTPGHREVFDYGGTARFNLFGGLAAEGQLHGVHHGGQLHDAGPVLNYTAGGAGFSWKGTSSAMGDFTFLLLALGSRRSRETFAADQPSAGKGVYGRLGIHPWERTEIWLIGWKGKDFYADEGDPNYGSFQSATPDIGWKSDRTCLELGIRRTFQLARRVEVDLDARLHRIEDKTEYSYRFTARVPFEWPAPGKVDSH